MTRTTTNPVREQLVDAGYETIDVVFNESDGVHPRPEHEPRTNDRRAVS